MIMFLNANFRNLSTIVTNGYFFSNQEQNTGILFEFPILFLFPNPFPFFSTFLVFLSKMVEYTP